LLYEEKGIGKRKPGGIEVWKLGSLEDWKLRICERVKFNNISGDFGFTVFDVLCEPLRNHGATLRKY
jgi:hypothetical protein